MPDQHLSTSRIPVPLHPWVVLFMQKKTKYCFLSNFSDEIRWNFDLRILLASQHGNPASPATWHKAGTVQEAS